MSRSTLFNQNPWDFNCIYFFNSRRVEAEALTDLCFCLCLCCCVWRWERSQTSSFSFHVLLPFWHLYMCLIVERTKRKIETKRRTFTLISLVSVMTGLERCLLPDCSLILFWDNGLFTELRPQTAVIDVPTQHVSNNCFDWWWWCHQKFIETSEFCLKLRIRSEKLTSKS